MREGRVVNRPSDSSVMIWLEKDHPGSDTIMAVLAKRDGKRVTLYIYNKKAFKLKSLRYQPPSARQALLD